jgi:hypothetical protein
MGPAPTGKTELIVSRPFQRRRRPEVPKSSFAPVKDEQLAATVVQCIFLS